jgi:hypothetical protein
LAILEALAGNSAISCSKYLQHIETPGHEKKCHEEICNLICYVTVSFERLLSSMKNLIGSVLFSLAINVRTLDEYDIKQ